MKKKKDIVDKAIESLKNQPIPSGPNEQTIVATVARLAEASSQIQEQSARERTKVIDSITKIAVAAVVLIVAGYAVGRLTAPGPPNLEHLHHSLETSLKSSLERDIGTNLLEEINQQQRLAFASIYIQLRNDLNQQLRRDMEDYAAQVFAASNAVTDQMLTGLVESINNTQAQQRHWIAAALQQMELNRLQDNSQLKKDLASLAVYTGDELLRQKQDVAKWITYSSPDKFTPNKINSLNNSYERAEK